ncbi:MAG: hypothetical protein JO036_14920 [Candidatus Eremiobacteraeota bacterium]|nr:hypothetical protein [Candidatus Eremiobacteraeota bacterium]
MNGVPLNDCEAHLAIVIQRIPGPPQPQKSDTPLPPLRDDRRLDDTRLVMEVNVAGACVESSTMITDEYYKACKVSATPTPSPTPSPGAQSNPTPSPTPGTTPRFDGIVTVPWSALNELFARPVPPSVDAKAVKWNSDAERQAQPGKIREPVGFRVCYETGPEFPNKLSRVETRYKHYKDLVMSPPSAPDQYRGCFDLVVVYRDATKGSYNYSTGSKSGNASNDSSSGSTAGTSGRLRALATSGSGAAPNPTPSPAAAPKLTLTLAQPLTPYWQVSGEGNIDNLVLPSLSKQTNTTLTQVVQQQAAQQLGQLVPQIGTSTTSTAFNAADADLLQRLLASTFRGYTDPATTLTKPAQAFDGTDVLDLQPFNVSLMKVVTAGGKISSVNPFFNAFDQRLGVASLGWFHDASLGESGTVFHVDQDVTSNLSVGVSHVIGNRVATPDNAYIAYPNPNPALVAYPVTSPSPNPVRHSANTVGGVLYKFGNGNDAAQPFQLFLRAGTNGYGRDYLAAISGSDLGDGHAIKPDGTMLGLSAMAGYRHISYTYDPLLANYDPLAGNSIWFGRASLALTRPKNGDKADQIDDRSGTLPYTLTVAGVYANDWATREYGSFGVSPSIPTNAHPKPEHWTISANGLFQRSYISATVLARQSGNFIYPRGNLNLLNNDAATLDLQLQNPSNAVDWTATVTAGLAMTHSPSCTSNAASPTCISPYTNKPTWGLNAGWQSLVLYANTAPGSQRVSPTSVSGTIPANNILTTALVAFHFCGHPNGDSNGPWGAEPSLTYKNNIAQDGSAFQPGSLLEAGIDVGPTNGINLGVLGKAVLSITYQNARNTQGSPVSLANHGWGINLISASQAMWQAHKVKTDKCLQSAK